jgi:hypothetical protein
VGVVYSQRNINYIIAHNISSVAKIKTLLAVRKFSGQEKTVAATKEFLLSYMMVIAFTLKNET